MSKKTPTKGKTSNIQEEVIKTGEGSFHFVNGDFYEGGYMIINNSIYRHGYGIYKTKDQDEYRAIWDKDRITSNLCIVYANKAEYNGEVNDEGAMTGKGTYTFPDDTSLTAYWQDNEPVSNFLYKDPLGYGWLGKLTWDKQDIIFSPENHIL